MFTVVTTNPSSLIPGSGTFTGKICFDLAQGNDGANSCGSLTGRLSQQTNFSDRNSQDGATGSYSGVQVYTFTPTGAVSHVRFAYVEDIDNYSPSVDSIVPALATYATADNISTACKVTVYYRKELNDDLQGTTRFTGNKLKLYAIYNSQNTYSDTANDARLELGVSLQDCSCCGAYATGDKWLNFMCYNLGANESYDPFTPCDSIQGAMYKWGIATPVISQYENVTYSGTYSNWDTKGGTPPVTTDDWDMKTANPCPAGWRLPALTEWEAVTSNNKNQKTYPGTWINDATNFSAGIQIGEALFLPADGYRFRSTGQLANRGVWGSYWSSSASSTDVNRGDCLYFSNNVFQYYYGINDVNSRLYGYSVRCVAD
jgi:uncharacterized protein (TIGR02145 family)